MANFFKSFSIFPSVRADDEEIVDPQAVLREKCSKVGTSVALYAKYQECNDRVNSKSKTLETCTEELIDYLSELDKCVGKDLFAKLK